jgi:hypothetical protein
MKVVLVGKPTGGAEGVMMSLRLQEGLAALDAVRVNVRGVVVFSIQGAAGYVTLTIRPVESTVGDTAGSLEVTA